MIISKPYRFLFCLLVVAVLGGVAFLYYQHRTSSSQGVRPAVPAYRHSKHSLRMGGFKFVGNYEGKRIISIRADLFTIEKKKLGFFRFGLLNVARFRNAVIDIYGEKIRSATGAAPVSIGQTAEIFKSQQMTFKEVFRKEALPSFPVKRISSILIEPVTVNLHDGNSVVTRISAASATISLKRRSILFKGNVRVASGSRSLRTDRLVLLPENAVIKIDRRFVLKTPEKELDGEHLTTDIFLRYVKMGQS